MLEFTLICHVYLIWIAKNQKSKEIFYRQPPLMLSFNSFHSFYNVKLLNLFMGKKH